MIRILALTILAGVLAMTAGCRSTSQRQTLFGRHHASPATAVYVPPGAPTPCPPSGPPTGAFPVVPSAPPRSALPVAPSGPPSSAFPIVPSSPPSSGFPVVPANPQPPTITPLSPADPSKSRIDPNLRPTDSREPARDPRIQLYAPETLDKDKPRPTEEPPLVRKQIAGTTLPPIPQFASAKENAFAGRRPPREGLDWLQAKGVKTIVQVRLFGEDDSMDRKEAEARQMRYVAFEVSPLVLTKEKADEFIKLIRDGAKQGVFVFDHDGSLAGAMWYLHFRWGEFYDDETSQLRARSLGLDLNREGQHRDMWLAVQKLLSENNR